MGILRRREPAVLPWERRGRGPEEGNEGQRLPRKRAGLRNEERWVAASIFVPTAWCVPIRLGVTTTSLAVVAAGCKVGYLMDPYTV